MTELGIAFSSCRSLALLSENHARHSGLTPFWISNRQVSDLSKLFSERPERAAVFLSVKLGQRKQCIPLSMASSPSLFFFFPKVCFPFMILVQPIMQCKRQNNCAHYLDCFRSCGKTLLNISKSFIIWIMHTHTKNLIHLLKLKVGLWHYYI